MKKPLIFAIAAGLLLAALTWFATDRCKPGYAATRVGSMLVAGCE